MRMFLATNGRKFICTRKGIKRAKVRGILSVSVSEQDGQYDTLLSVSYHLLIDFSNTLTKTAIERLAEADEYELVREVQVRATLC